MSRQLDEGPSEPLPPPEPGPHHLRPADWRVVLACLVAGALLGWLVVSLFRLVEASLPVTPWTMSVVLTVAGVFAALTRRGLVEQLGGALAVTIGRTMLVTGLLVAGAHVSWALAQLGGWQVELFRRRAVAALGAVVAGVVFALGGWLLERACRVPRDPSDTPR